MLNGVGGGAGWHDLTRDVTVCSCMSRLLGAPDYALNLASFWVLDIVSEALLVAQIDKNMSDRNQRIMITWFGHMFNQMRGKSVQIRSFFHLLVF